MDNEIVHILTFRSAGMTKGAAITDNAMAAVPVTPAIAKPITLPLALLTPGLELEFTCAHNSHDIVVYRCTNLKNVFFS